MTDFDPMNADRPPREDGWKEETEAIFERIRNRVDQRIGQYLLNALSTDGVTDPERMENRLWNIEAPELLDLLRQFDDVMRGE